MPDREKVIKGLEILMNGCEYIHCDDCCFYISAKPTRCGLREEQIQEDALSLLKEQPELVQCKDCKHHGKDTCSAAAGIAYPPPDEWFCADGERKDGDGDAR